MVEVAYNLTLPSNILRNPLTAAYLRIRSGRYLLSIGL